MKHCETHQRISADIIMIAYLDPFFVQVQKFREQFVLFSVWIRTSLEALPENGSLFLRDPASLSSSVHAVLSSDRRFNTGRLGVGRCRCKCNI